MTQELNFNRSKSGDLAETMANLVRPAGGYVSMTDSLAAALLLRFDALVDQRSLPLGDKGQQLLGLRYLIENGSIWFRFFTWKKTLAALDDTAPERVQSLWERIEAFVQNVQPEVVVSETLASGELLELARPLQDDLLSDVSLRLVVEIQKHPAVREALRSRLDAEASTLLDADPEATDWLYLLTHDLERQPATTVTAGRLEYIIVADKGEMGVRAVREAAVFGAIPIALFSKADDADALAVREAEKAGGFGIGLEGSFRESYANPVQIVERVVATYKERFGDGWRDALSRSAIYPGYGPLAENSVAIQHFRRSGIAFIGPMQDVVERAGDKRKFRRLAESIDPKAVAPGIVIDASDAESILRAVEQGHAAGKFAFPGRLKAANGGGGRGQAVIDAPEGVPAAVTKVLAEIEANGWDPGVMFEENIFETIHLEVQVVRDRFGNTRHFGMRDCSEQRASQKIQEEAPPALLREHPELERQMCEIAVRIADEVGYAGACTVELMYKNGSFYLLEMNTRIQVEHPVTEEAHRIRRGGVLEPLDLVQLQFQVAAGRALDFAQDDVVQTRVAREFRINAESYKPQLKDPRDGGRGMFLPNGGVFDVMELPTEAEILAELERQGIEGVEHVGIRFDCGFEVGDELLNKDPTFGKLLVSVAPQPGFEARQYENLRLVSIEVLQRMKIEGRQMTPAGKVLDMPFETNLEGHVEVLESSMLKTHCQGTAPDRHVGWVIDYLRQKYS